MKPNLFSAVVLLLAVPAFGAGDIGQLQKVDATGKPDGAAIALNDVRCRYDGKKFSVQTGGESNVQFLLALDNFEILPATTSWKGATFGVPTDAFFQDVGGKRYRASEATRCDVSMEREATTTKLDVKCTALMEADLGLREEKNVVAARLACANTKLVTR